MTIGYTEFSFEYAFTENLIRSSIPSPTGAPVFPNLIQEGKLGFDIRIDFPGVPLFFQFKLPKLLRLNTASEIKSGLCPALKTPFFRISMMRADWSHQHEILMKLEDRWPQKVFYAAPFIRSLAEFDKAYNVASVAQKTAFFSPSEIGKLPDNKEHSIAYREGLPMAYFCSDPREINVISFDALIAPLRKQFEEPRLDSIQDSAREIRELVVEFASASMRQGWQQIRDRIRARRMQVVDPGPPSAAEEERTIVDILVAREIARVDMGLDLLISQPR